MKFPELLRIAVVPKAGIFEVGISEKNESILKGGSEKEFVELLAHYLHFEYKIVPPADSEWGQLLNGSWTGVIGLVHRGEADIGIGKISITTDRQTVVDYSYPYDIEDLTFATAVPGFYDKTTAFVTPFDWYTWCTLLFVLFIYLMTLQILQRKSFQLVLLQIVGYIFQQPLLLVSTARSVKCLVLFWILIARFIPLFYSAALLSFLTIPVQKRGIENIPELSQAIADGTYSCATFKGTSYMSLLLNSQQTMVNIITDHITQKNALIEPSEEAILNVLKVDGSVIASRNFLRSHVHNILISQDSFMMLTRSIVLKKSFCCSHVFDRFIFRMNAAGLYKKMHGDVLFRRKLSLQSLVSSNDENVKYLTVDDLLGAFAVLLMGHVFAILVYVIGLFFRRLQ